MTWVMCSEGTLSVGGVEVDTGSSVENARMDQVTEYVVG